MGGEGGGAVETKNAGVPAQELPVWQPAAITYVPVEVAATEIHPFPYRLVIKWFEAVGQKKYFGPGPYTKRIGYPEAGASSKLTVIIWPAVAVRLQVV